MLQLSAILSLVGVAVAAIPWNQMGPNWGSESPWSDWPIKDSFQLPAPWKKADYAEPECFSAVIDGNGNVVDPQTLPFDAQAKCPLCKGLTESLPGYTPDPYNCQWFYSCVKFGNTWVAYRMPCPPCQFWNQEILTCQLVAHDTCKRTTPAPVTWEVPSRLPPIKPRKTTTCINFDYGWDGVQGLNGIWVYNSGVTITDVDCRYNNCGMFSGDVRLEVPFYSNNWERFKEFSYSLWFKADGTVAEEGLLSNDCFDDQPGRQGNSLYASSIGDIINTGLKKPDADALGVNAANIGDWHHLALTWDGNVMQVYIDGVPVLSPAINFPGPIRSSPEHCPLVIGSFILPPLPSYFNGFMDEICFFNVGLTQDEVTMININPEFAYYM